MENKKKLKHLENKDRKGFFIGELLPSMEREQKQRVRSLLFNNKTSVANKVEMSTFKGGLKIQNEVYKQKVREPECSEILGLDEKEMNQVLDIKLSRGETIEQENNSFIGFCKDAQDYGTIRKSYMHLKLMYPRANHIMCAYNIPGNQPFYNKDYCDGGDHGVAKHILKMMEENNITSKAIFVLRVNKSNTKIGPARINCAIKAA